MANRISHFFNLRGPSMAVDSACSSSLTALHLATRAILAGECSMALVGGVNLTLHPEKLIKMADEGLASADGHTRSFSANADGFSVGEGVGALVLKPLASALRDEDMIYGLVRGTAANHGGRSRSYRVPNPRAQASVIGRALDAAQVPPDSISYVEANGGATMLGDPLEVRALSLGYGVNAGSAAPCAIGSIKSNLGNLEAASGVAAVTKVLLQFRHRMLVPSLHADDPNPDIALEQTRFELQAKAAEWGVPASPTSEDARPLRAAINSFGAGGANAHVILEEWPRRKQVGRLTGGQRVLLVLSAMSELQLNDYAARIASFIETDDGRSASVQDIAFTLQGGREELPHRAALITTSLGEARQQLRDVARGACPATGWRAEAERTPGVLHDNASLEELASHWVKGGSVQWRARVAAFGGQRVSLPAYPFQKTSHWFTERPGSTTNEDATLSLHRTAWLPVQLSHVDGRSKAGWVLGGAGRLAETLGLVWVSSAEALAEALTSGRPRPDRIVVDATEHQDATDIPTTVQAELALAAAQLQALLTEPALAKTRVVWVTSSAVSAGPEDVAHDLSRAPLWGAVRGWRSQHPHRGMRLVDLGQRDADRDQLWSTILADEEPEFAIRHDAVLRPVLQHVGEDPRTLEAPAGVAAWHVEQSGGGLRDGLSLVSAPKVLEPLSAGEVRLEMRSLGLNLLDVVRTLGMVDVADRPMLGEGAGVVAEVGPLVQDLREGDRVMGLLRTAGGPTAVASRSQLAPIPPGLSDVEAATIPVNFLTALLGLDCLAQLQPGERVLIHAAAGGTGMAAVQLARRIGAEVFATASEHKWPLLRAMGLDDAHLASSRDTGFADHFLSSTNGEGVDVVLNSLAGKFVDASLRVLRPGGRFLEMGKTDIRDADAVERRYPQVIYRAFDLTSDGESVCQELLVRIASLFARGLLSIPPLQTYDLRHAPLALRHMASARHVGKIVLQVPRHLRNGGTVLIANAGGPMGRALAHHLIREHDVRHLLVTLESAQGSEAEEFAAELKSAGVESVEVMGCDLAQPAEVERMLGSIPAEHGLTGVFYFAPSAVRSSRPKLPASPHPEIASAWHLHTLTEHLDLSTFVTVSPAPPPTDAGSLSPSTAAGSFLDALASYRKKRGLAGLSFAWPVDRAPPLDASRNSNAHSTMFASDTLTPVSVARAMQWMERAMQRPEAALVALGAESVSHPKLSGAASARSFSPRSAGHRRRPATPSELRQRLAPLHQSDRLEKLSALVREETADVLGLAGPRAVPVDRPLSELGLDSLMGVELSTQLSRWVDAPLPSSLVFDHPTPRAITQMLLARAGFASVSSWTDDDIRAKLQRLSIPDLRGAGPLLQQLMNLREAEPRAHERSDAGTTIDALAGDSLLLHAEHVLRGDA
ncbi:MAG: beta-ketoacyl synthase N-terminal-like domain-containing protein [Myxococcales bacterium]|nr:beta-ketoacyl synthase N-terminal-like domain-containing protein [Myxococcales bacterium]